MIPSQNSNKNSKENSKVEFSPLLLSDKQVADLLGCHRNTIWNRVKNGQMPKPIRWEGKTVWPHKVIIEYVDNLAA